MRLESLEVAGESDDRNAGRFQPIDGAHEALGGWRHDNDAIAPSPFDSRQLLLDCGYGELGVHGGANAKHRRPLKRQFRRQSDVQRLQKVLRRLDNEVGDQLAPCHRQLLPLFFQFDDGLMHPVQGLLTNVAAPIERSIHRRGTHAGLQRDILDEKMTLHFLM